MKDWPRRPDASQQDALGKAGEDAYAVSPIFGGYKAFRTLIWVLCENGTP